ncbi:hypothetical protein H5T87_00435 [bacterium]|nr:hypothetical protein [bacterium]
MKMLFLIGILTITLSFTYAQQAGMFNVKDFGAKGDGTTDDTKAFQAALDACGEAGGGIVFAPTGNYLIKGHLSIPPYVTLEGVWRAPSTWSQYKGTTLLAVEGEGEENGTPFITLHTSSTLKGVTIFYPNQKADNIRPYPWTIRGRGDNCSVIDVLIVNPYQAVDFGTYPCGRHYVRGLYAQPLRKGLYIDQCYDIGRVENVHFWPFWTWDDKSGIRDYLWKNGEAFIIGRTDWEYVYNTFCFGYKIGYRFIRTKNGVANGNFLGIGADATEIALLVEDCATYGLLITNGEFVSFAGENPIEVVVAPTNTGMLLLQNCAFWGPSNQIAKIEGKGTVSFQNCNFDYWDKDAKGLPAIEVLSGDVIVNGCLFNRDAPQVYLGKDVRYAVITSNRFTGFSRIINEAKGNVQIGLNAAFEIKEEAGSIVIDDSFPEPLFKKIGEWYLAKAGGDYGGSSLWAPKGDGNAKAIWSPKIEKKGYYNVYVWFGEDPNKDHASNAEFEIYHAKGKTIKIVDLTKNFSCWHLLGRFYFEPNAPAKIVLSNKANGNVVADAVKLVPTK